MDHDADILIVGGGLNGPILALALARVGLTSIICDARPDTPAEQGFDGRSYALAHASIRMLEALELWEHLSETAQPIFEIKASDGQAGMGAAPWHLHFQRDDLEEGPMGHMVEDRYLRAALARQVAATPSIDLRDGVQAVAQESAAHAVALTLSTGETLRGRLLIGADGRKSGVAARAGIKRIGWEYDQTAVVAAIAHADPHHGVAHQFFMPTGPLAILPLQGNRASIVWSTRRAEAGALAALDDADFLMRLRPAFGDFLGDIDLDGARWSYPLGLSLAQSFVAERVALIGDAAHGIHPIAGQGLNLGLRDAAALAEVLAGAKRRGQDITAADILAEYQRWRRFDTVAMALATDTFYRLFSNANPILRAGRDLGLGLVGAIGPLRRGFQREAAGLTGDVPRLMRGLPI